MTALAAAIGIATDRLVGEPPTSVHPVAAFGSAMQSVEGRIYSPTRRAGIAHLAVGAGVGALAGVALQRSLGRPGAAAVAAAVAIGGKMLGDVALQIGEALELTDLDQARDLLPALAGRCADDLDATEITRAVIESVAENTIDAVVAPALWAAVAGAPGALAYRAVNTLDAMVGHHSVRYEDFGWASARFDDLVNWLPARAGVAAVIAARPRRAAAVVRCIGGDAGAHPSPNAGVIEAAFAGALGVQLGGVNRYGDTVEDRGRLRGGPEPVPSDVRRAVRLARDVGLVVAASLTIPSLVRNSSRRPRGRCPGRSRFLPRVVTL